MRFALLVLFLSGIQIATQQATAKIRQYQEVMNLDPQTISANCQEVKKYYELSIEAYDFLQSFTVEAMEETLQKQEFEFFYEYCSIGKLRTLGQQLEGEATATFEQQALREQLDETRNERRLQELEWRVNWSNNAESSDVSAEEISAMKEEISSISGEKQKELDQLIQQKTVEQSQIIEQIQLGETSYNKLNADKKDLQAEITVLKDRLEDNERKHKETIEGNSTSGENLKTLQLQLSFFNEKKKSANSYDAIKQLSQLSMKTEDQISEVRNGIEGANQAVVLIEQSSKEANESLTEKQAELERIELQMESINTQLLQVRRDSEQVTNSLQQAKQEQEMLLSQIKQKQEEQIFSKELQSKEQSFLQLGSRKEGVPVTSKAPIKEAYPVPKIKGQKGKVTEQTVKTDQLESIDPKVETQRRGKSVNGIKELILKYEELITLKEMYLEKQLKIVVTREETVTRKEKEIRAAKRKIKSAVDKCKKEKRNILLTAREERKSKAYQEALEQAKRRLNSLVRKLKAEMRKEQEIFKRKKRIEKEEKELQEKQSELDKVVEAIEKKIFQSTQKKKSQFIQLEESINTSNNANSNNLNDNNSIPESNFLQKTEVLEPKPEAQLIKEEIKVDAEQKKVEIQQQNIEQKQEQIKLDELEAQKKVMEIEQKEKELQQKQIETQKEIEKVNEEINKCKLILNSGDKQSQEYQVCEWQSQDYNNKLQQLQQLKQDYQSESNEFQQEKEQFYSAQANNLLYSFAEVSINTAQQQLKQMSEELQNNFNNLLQFSDSNNKSLSKSKRHDDGMVYLLENCEKLTNDLKTVMLSTPDNRDQIKVTLKQVIDEINKLYETAIVQRNLKQGQNLVLEKQRALGKLQQACLEAQRLLQEEK